MAIAKTISLEQGGIIAIYKTDDAVDSVDLQWNWLFGGGLWLNMRRTRIYFGASAALLTMMALTFLLIPLVSEMSTDDNRMPYALAGAEFWIGFIGGYIFYFLAVKNYKKTRERYGIKENKQKMPYVLSNFPTAIADGVFAVSLLGFLFLTIVHKMDSYFVFVWIFGLVWSVQMHFLFCGKLYNFVKNKRNGHKK